MEKRLLSLLKLSEIVSKECYNGQHEFCRKKYVKKLKNGIIVKVECRCECHYGGLDKFI